MVTITDDAVAQFGRAWHSVPEGKPGDRRRAALLDILTDTYLLREQGVRVLADDQCCELACSGGACESCPCCCAGWCVNGRDGEIPTNPENYGIWLEEAKEHNPIAARLAEQSS